MQLQAKWKSINYLSPAELKVDIKNNWYISQKLEAGGDGFLRGITGRGKTIEEAINNHWNKLTNSNIKIIKNAYQEDRREFVWNGIMFEEQKD